MNGHNRLIKCISIYKNGKFFVSGSDDQTIKVWSAMTGKHLKILLGHSKSV